MQVLSQTPSTEEEAFRKLCYHEAAHTVFAWATGGTPGPVKARRIEPGEYGRGMAGRVGECAWPLPEGCRYPGIRAALGAVAGPLGEVVFTSGMRGDSREEFETLERMIAACSTKPLREGGAEALANPIVTALSQRLCDFGPAVLALAPLLYLDGEVSGERAEAVIAGAVALAGGPVPFDVDTFIEREILAKVPIPPDAAAPPVTTGAFRAGGLSAEDALRRQGAPVDDPAAMARWCVLDAWKNDPAGFMAWLQDQPEGFQAHTRAEAAVGNLPEEIARCIIEMQPA